MHIYILLFYIIMFYGHKKIYLKVFNIDNVVMEDNT